MKKLIKNTTLYLVLLLLLIFVILKIPSIYVENRNFENYQTESNLLIMDRNIEYDIVIMGISHARNFSRHKNHLRIENILDKKILNIGQGAGGCGANEQLFFLDYFYHKKNKTEILIYMISPPLFFSEALPIASNTFDKEPFELDFFLRYLFFPSENKGEREVSYLKSKITKAWVNLTPLLTENKNEKLDSINPKAVKAGQEFAYNNTLSMSRFEKTSLSVEKAISLALDNNSEVILIIPPALFGKWKGHDNVSNFALEMAKKEDVKYYDFSESVLFPKYYYDHHHLNTDGVVFFTKHYINAIINEKR